MGGAAGDGADIEAVLQGAKFAAVGIDNCNVVLLVRQVLAPRIIIFIDCGLAASKAGLSYREQ
jgi:hypothetical protein